MYIGKRHIWERVLPFGLMSHRIQTNSPSTDGHLSHCLHSMKRHIYQALAMSWSLGVTRCTDLPLWWYVIQSDSLTVESIVPRPVSLVTRSHPSLTLYSLSVHDACTLESDTHGDWSCRSICGHIEYRLIRPNDGQHSHCLNSNVPLSTFEIGCSHS
mgnify:CR=1 FL=1